MRSCNPRFKYFIYCLVFFSFSKNVSAQQKFGIENVSGFSDSKHHWMDITDHEQVIVPLKDQQSYPPSNVREIANNILLYQQPNGGWPKNYDMLAILTTGQKNALTSHKDSNHTTIDNGATYTQTEYLAKAYSILGDKKYKDASIRGINFMLNAQYDNGGWPQFYPDKSGYRKYITFNDDAMIGVLTVFQHIVQNEAYFSFIDNDLRNRVEQSYQKGIACILKCQVKENGKPTVWCQQHDNITLKPVGARSFELASKASEESANIVEFLMQIKHPNKQIVDAVTDAVNWFKEVAIKDARIKTVPAKDVVYKYHEAKDDKIVVTDSAAPDMWTRYYELGTNRPFFANRDGKPVYEFSEVSRERRTGYAWYGYWPEKIIREYPKWLQKMKGENEEK